MGNKNAPKREAKKPPKKKVAPTRDEFNHAGVRIARESTTSKD